MVSQKVHLSCSEQDCAATSSLRKVGAARRAARYRATRRVAPTIGFARLAIETIVPLTFYEIVMIDGLVKSLKLPIFVIPAKAGIQFFQVVTTSLDSGFHRSDDFLRNHPD